ncbi:hypothetical protein [Wansuia hejianensis]|uniref:Uncharacterized protein n=1 Tax=Wansuia hejianensis TaxID=2763667 RepID=A0A7G9GFL3_9FIRM|nr:hypothetical protein [Wansuia hejianensis]QNM09595.1 hypothetical protein H9Q79_04710 [Wansuia hejianensis]RHV90491.1 hypothetical protein DXA96_07070 [Lachnospiraceae bacterium OF09-33XD]
MLERKDLEAIAKLIDVKLEKTERILLDEIVRTQNILEEKINTVQKNIDELKQYYKITRLESDNTSLLIQMITELQKRVTELESKIA